MRKYLSWLLMWAIFVGCFFLTAYRVQWASGANQDPASLLTAYQKLKPGGDPNWSATIICNKKQFQYLQRGSVVSMVMSGAYRSKGVPNGRFQVFACYPQPGGIYTPVKLVYGAKGQFLFALVSVPEMPPYCQVTINRVSCF